MQQLTVEFFNSLMTNDFLITIKAHKHGAGKWTKAQHRTFANDFENLLVVDDSINKSKSDKAPHEWLPPLKSYWREYGKRWERIKIKYKCGIASKSVLY